MDLKARIFSRREEMEKNPLATSYSQTRPHRFWPRFRDVILGVVVAGIAARLLPATGSGAAVLRFAGFSIDDSGSVSAHKGWKDDVYPIFPTTPWDISTDFPYPRKLKYEVTEGTWLRLDVHPSNGEIVFDMMGTFIC